MLTYLAMLMTSWAIVCDVDYLEPTSLQVCACMRSVYYNDNHVYSPVYY